MTIHIEGYQNRDFSEIIPGIYDADVSLDGTQMLNGVWGAEGAIPGTWEATLVPEPCTLLLVGLGGLLIKKR